MESKKINAMKKDVAEKKATYESQKTELDIAYRDLKKDHGVKTVGSAKKMGTDIEKEIKQLNIDGTKLINEADKLLKEYES